MSTHQPRARMSTHQPVLTFTSFVVTTLDDSVHWNPEREYIPPLIYFCQMFMTVLVKLIDQGSSERKFKTRSLFFPPLLIKT